MQLRRVGGQNPLSIDVRFIAATNRNLQAMVEEGLFREDLWYRLNVYPIHIPPLRERLADISELTYYFASLKSKEMNLYDDVGFAPEAMDQLRAYNWPGNVRELQNVIERALIVSRGEPLSFSNLTGPRHKVPAGNGLMDPGGFPTMDELIINHIRKSLVIANGKINGPGGAAELLGLNPSTLRGKMRKLGIKIGRTAS